MTLETDSSTIIITSILCISSLSLLCQIVRIRYGELKEMISRVPEMIITKLKEVMFDVERKEEKESMYTTYTT